VLTHPPFLFRKVLFMAKVNTVGMRMIQVNVDAANVAKPISPTTLFVTDFEIFISPSNVGANMYIGNKAVTNQWIPRPKGELYNFTHGDGELIGCNSKVAFDLSKLFVVGDAALDTAIIQYFAQDNHGN